MNDRNGKFGAESGRYGAIEPDVGNWSSLGAPLVEIAAIKLTVGLPAPMSGIGRAI